MSTQSERIKERRKELGLTQQQVADPVGVSRVSITQWENDPSVRISGANLARLAKVLKVSTNYILNGGPSRMEEPSGQYHLENNLAAAPAMHGQVPVISWVQAGAFTEVCHVELDPEDTIWLPRPPGASEDCFALRVVGDSMVPRYNPGTLIFVDPEVQPENGDDVVARLTDSSIEEATFKRLILEPGAPKTLMAINPNWPHRFIEINGNCEIIGTVIADMNLRRR